MVWFFSSPNHPVPLWGLGMKCQGCEADHSPLSSAEADHLGFLSLALSKIMLCQDNILPKVSLLWCSDQMILRAMLAVALLPVGHPKPDRWKVMAQTKRGTLLLQVGGWEWGWQPNHIKNIFCWDASKIGNRVETTKTTQHEKGFTSENWECAVCL